MPPDPQYLRAGQIYFELAQQMSLPTAADVFRVTAEEYMTHAAELDARSRGEGPAIKEPEG